jgi:DNA polymerase
VDACRPWLLAEIEAVRPAVLVCLGSTAAQSLLGRSFRVTADRGRVLRDTTWATGVIATYHPSALLRIPDERMRANARGMFTADLAQAARLLAAA